MSKSIEAVVTKYTKTAGHVPSWMEEDDVKFVVATLLSVISGKADKLRHVEKHSRSYVTFNGLWGTGAMSGSDKNFLLSVTKKIWGAIDDDDLSDIYKTWAACKVLYNGLLYGSYKMTRSEAKNSGGTKAVYDEVKRISNILKSTTGGSKWDKVVQIANKKSVKDLQDSAKRGY